MALPCISHVGDMISLTSQFQHHTTDTAVECIGSARPRGRATLCLRPSSLLDWLHTLLELGHGPLDVAFSSNTSRRCIRADTSSYAVHGSALSAWSKSHVQAGERCHNRSCSSPRSVSDLLSHKVFPRGLDAMWLDRVVSRTLRQSQNMVQSKQQATNIKKTTVRALLYISLWLHSYQQEATLLNLLLRMSTFPAISGDVW
jgi:hypothetical protein